MKPFVTAAVSLLAFAGCGSSSSTDTLKEDLLDGISQLRDTRDYRQVRAGIVRTLARLKQDRASTAAARRAKQLAVRGFSLTLKGIDSRIAFVENDSGNIEAATKDAKHADRFLGRGARVLRAAARSLGVQVGSLNGY